MRDRSPEGGRTRIREVQHSLGGARDEQITRVVAMVDGLADRAAADALIAPLRPRLAQLRPPRPLRLSRLLFIPVEALIVPAPAWRPNQPAVPRTALTPLADVVRAEAATAVGAAEALIAGRCSADADAIGAATALLWPVAARVLAACGAPPPSWSETGLPQASFLPLARGVGGVLEHGSALDRMQDAARHGDQVPDSEIGAMLEAAALHGPEAWSMMVATLLARLADPAPVVRRLAGDLALHADPGVRARAARVTDAMLDRLDAADPSAGLIAGTELGEAGAEVRRAVMLLDALDGPSATPARRKRVQELRRQLDASSRARFEAGLARGLLDPLTEQLAQGDAVAIGALEAAARALRQLETIGRKLGNGQATMPCCGARRSRSARWAKARL